MRQVRCVLCCGLARALVLPAWREGAAVPQCCWGNVKHQEPGNKHSSLSVLSTCHFLDKQVKLIVLFKSSRGANNVSPVSPFCPCYPKPNKYRNAPSLFYWNTSKVNIILPFFFSSIVWIVYLLISFLCFVFLQLISLVDNFSRNFCISSTNTRLSWLLCPQNIFFAHDSLQNILSYPSLCHLFFFPTYCFLFSSAFHLSFTS